MRSFFTGILLFISFSLLSQEDDKIFNVVNNSDHSVTKIFDNGKPGSIRFNTSLFKDWDVLRMNNTLYMYFPNRESFNNRLEITYQGVISTMKFMKFFRPVDTLKTYSYRTNINYYEDDEGFHAEEIFDTLKFEFTNAEIEVYREGNRCNDSGWNSLRIIFANGDILFKNMNNVKFFESDLNNDGTPEIYIIHFSCCDEKMKIFRVI